MSTGKVAPHINNEVRLVLGGYKPLATIEKGKDPLGYAMAISLASTGTLVAEVGPTHDSPSGEVVIVKPGNQYLIKQYNYMIGYGVAEHGIKAYHRCLGKLFGYSKEDIEEFIATDINCDCSKCTGERQ